MSKPVTSDLFKFSGRRNRKSYFLFLVVMIVVWIILGVIFGVAGGLGAAMMGGADASADSGGGMAIGMSVVIGIIAIVLAVMSIAVGSQRCRDFGWTGWAMLLSLIPIVGVIFALALLFIPGNKGPNKYGPDPLQQAT